MSLRLMVGRINFTDVEDKLILSGGFLLIRRILYFIVEDKFNR